MKLSPLGIFHTIIGIIAVVTAIISLLKYGKINLAKLPGKIYYYTTLVTSITALTISKHGGFNAGHGLSILVVVLVLTAYFLHARKPGNNRSRHFENFFLTFSLLLSLLPTVNETFTRIPIGHPLAKDISDPIIGKTLLALFVLFIIGAVLQIVKQRRLNLAA